MIPRLATDLPTAADTPDFLDALVRRGFTGDIGADDASRAVFATDNSIYRVPPRAVLFPRGRDDVVRIARLASEPRFRSIPLAPRGGGTGTNGQSLTDGVMVDLSRHMNRILAIDPVARRARVEAGVVKDQLNAALKPHGLFFAPELSTSNRATLGGMIGTDACGQGSCLYGKTHHHVLGLTTVLEDGTVWASAPLDEPGLRAVQARPDRVGEVHRVVDALHRRDGALFGTHLPVLNRNVTGYDLAHVRDARGRFDLNAVLCGSEGTLGFIVEAELNVLPIPAHAALINVRYVSFDAALRDARDLMASRPASVETVDAKVLDLARRDPVWQAVSAYFPADSGEPPRGVNIVEFVGDTPEAVEALLAEAVAALEARAAGGRVFGHTVARDPAAIDAIWSMRKKAVGLLGNMSGPRRPIPFVEDTAVPPERLADYIAAFRAVLDRHGLVYGMFGHADAGVLHVRPALDMTDPAQRALVRTVSDEVAALTRAHGGVLWGEHGKGVRSEYAPDVFGPLYPAMQAIKAAFDPDDRLNPGKIAAPPAGRLLRIDGVPTRGAREEALPAAVRARHGNAFHCNGNGLCFDFDADSLMCPSYKGTRDRRHSPQGRATLMRDWLARLGDAPKPPGRRSALVAWPLRAFHTAGRLCGLPDASHEVMEAMDGCLSCKACVGQCPIKVDVPSFRATFFEAYHTRYLRSPGAVLMAWVEHLLPVAAAVRPAYDAAARSAGGRALLRLLGIAALPRMPAGGVAAGLARRGVGIATPAALAGLSEAERAVSVVLVPDTFTRAFEPALVLDVVDLVAALGYRPWVAPPRPTGKALHVQGLLGAFRRVARRTAEGLSALAATGVPLVGLDPAMTLTYRAEYARELGPGLAPKVLLLQEWLAEAGPGATPPSDPAGRYALLPHCTEQATASASVALWRDVFARFGLDLSILRAGCCGMAGTFGHEARHRALSAEIYRLSWRDKVSAHGPVLLATGHSCRSQAEIMDGATLRHPAQVLLAECRRRAPEIPVAGLAGAAVERPVHA